MIGTIISTVGFIVGGGIMNAMYDMIDSPTTEKPLSNIEEKKELDSSSDGSKVAENKEKNKSSQKKNNKEQSKEQKKEEKIEKINPEDVEVIKPEDVKTLDNPPANNHMLDPKALNDLANEAIIDLGITQDKEIAYLMVCTFVILENMTDAKYAVDVINHTADGPVIANSIMYSCKERYILPTQVYDVKEVCDIDMLLKIVGFLKQKFPQNKNFVKYEEVMLTEKAKPNSKLQDIILSKDNKYDNPRLPFKTYGMLNNICLNLFKDHKFKISVKRDKNNMINEGMAVVAVEFPEYQITYRFDIDLGSIGGIGISLMLPVVPDTNNLDRYEIMPVNIEKHSDIIYRFIQNKFSPIGGPVQGLAFGYSADVQSEQDAQTIMFDQIPFRMAYVMFDFTGFDFYTLDQNVKTQFSNNLAAIVNRNWEAEGIPRCRYKFVDYKDPNNFKCISDKTVKVQYSDWMLLPSMHTSVELICNNGVITAKTVENK